MAHAGQAERDIAISTGLRHPDGRYYDRGPDNISRNSTHVFFAWVEGAS